MSKNPINKGVVSDNSLGVGVVTRAMIQTRAHELALIAGRNPPLATPGDYEQAKRELSGEDELDPETAALEALPESERWDPVPGSTATEGPDIADEEDDDEGHNEAAQLVERGVSEAQHDQMLQAALDAEQRPKEP